MPFLGRTFAIATAFALVPFPTPPTISALPCSRVELNSMAKREREFKASASGLSATPEPERLPLT
jgi:hypothetical protein